MRSSRWRLGRSASRCSTRPERGSAGSSGRNCSVRWWRPLGWRSARPNRHGRAATGAPVDLDSGRSVQYLVSQENWMTVVRQVLRMPDYDELLERDGRQSRPSLRNARGRRRETGPLSPWRCEREHQWRQRLRASRTDSWSAPARAESSVSNARSPACVRTRNLVGPPRQGGAPRDVVSRLRKGPAIIAADTYPLGRRCKPAAGERDPARVARSKTVAVVPTSFPIGCRAAGLPRHRVNRTTAPRQPVY